VCVDAFHSDLYWFFPAGSGQSDVNGVYRVTVPDDGIYCLQASPQSNDELTVLDEWWTTDGGTRIYDEAEPVSVTSGETPGIDFFLDPAAIISGTVRDTGDNPLSDVFIDAFSCLCGNNYINNGTSDAEGKYRVFVPVNSVYYLQAFPQSNYPLAVIDEWWTAGGGTRICEEAGSVSVTSGETVGIDFSLDPAAIISGTVRDTDGNPLSNVFVEIYLDQCLGSVQVNRFIGASNENGDYRTVVPVDGTYYAYADPHSDIIDDLNLTVVDEWWTEDGGGTRVCEDASPISVAIAAEYPDIDFFLDPAAIISGTIRDTDGNPLPEVFVAAYEGTCAELYNGEIADVVYDYSSENGEYNLPIPVNGDYFVVVLPNIQSYSIEWWTENGHTSICEDASPISVAIAAEYLGIDFYFAIPDRNNDGDVDGMDLAMMITDFNSGLVSNVDLETFAVEFGRTQ
ncbi:MAG: hypothetical protein J7L35_04195, partial [Anaerolineales bacterium]|nr:hypothetical protein [Anaerolineales bacterium]